MQNDNSWGVVAGGVTVDVVTGAGVVATTGASDAGLAVGTEVTGTCPDGAATELAGADGVVVVGVELCDEVEADDFPGSMPGLAA